MYSIGSGRNANKLICEDMDGSCIGFITGTILSSLLLAACCCGLLCWSGHRRRARLASGRIGFLIPAVVVAPIIESDELQNEHERHVNNPSRNDPPPSYEE